MFLPKISQHLSGADLQAHGDRWPGLEVSLPSLSSQMGILRPFFHLILFPKALAARLPILYPIKPSDSVLNCLFKCHTCRIGYMNFASSQDHISPLHECIIQKRPMTEPGTFQGEESAAAGALCCFQHRQVRGEAGLLHPTRICLLRSSVSSLASCHRLIINSVALQVIQLPEPYACCTVGNWKWAQATLSYSRRGLARYGTPLLSHHPALNFWLSWWPGNHVLSFPAIICTTWVKIPSIHLIQHHRAKYYFSREFIGIITVPFPCEIK